MLSDYVRQPSEFERLTSRYSEFDGERFKIDLFELTPDEVKREKFRSALDGNYETRGLIPGKYVRLYDKEKHQIVMTNTWMEDYTNEVFVRVAKGDVLIGGLGLGLIVQLIQNKKDITSITIIEPHQEIIDFVTKTIPFNEKVKIIQGDVFTFAPESKYDVIYFDIWNTIGSDNYPEMKKLHAKYRKFRKEGKNSWMSSWRIEYCKQLYLEEKRYERELEDRFNARFG